MAKTLSKVDKSKAETAVHRRRWPRSSSKYEPEGDRTGGGCPLDKFFKLEKNTTVGKSYVVKEYLGGGAMADVYEVYDIEICRHVALKLSKVGIETEHLRTEGKMLGSLNHPGIVSIHDMGTHEDTPFLILERLRGVTLSDRLERTRDKACGSLSEIIDLAIQLCDLTAALHDAGIVHRDIKPENIMVEPGGRIVLFDFGVASSVRDRASNLAGTPGYMAPEIREQQSTEVNEGQDLYSLGCVIYELLTGSRPAVESHAVVTVEDIQEALFHASETHHVSTPFVRVLAAMLERDPTRRLRSARTAADWLRGIQAGYESLEAGTQSISILVVDDDPDIRSLMSALIERESEDIKIETAQNGEHALEYFMSDRCPDIVLLDLDMPVMTGGQLIKYLSGIALARRTTICIISGNCDTSRKKYFSRYGVRDFVDKSSSPELIVNTIRRLVSGAERRNRLVL